MTEKELAMNENMSANEYRAKKFINKHKKDHETKRNYPINVLNGYYARNEQEYKFDKMMRDHAKKTGQEAMYDHIAQQNLRNALRRIMDDLDYISIKLSELEDKLNELAR